MTALRPQVANFREPARVIGCMKLFILAAALVAATPTAAWAATDGTSNTIMFAKPHAFMDYTDDALSAEVPVRPTR